MADKAITNTKIAALNARQVFTATAADEDGAGVAQKFVYTPTGKDSKILAAADTITVTITKGTGVFAAASNTTLTIAAAGTDVFQLETGKYTLDDGTIEMSLDPTNALKKLVTDHAAVVYAAELI